MIRRGVSLLEVLFAIGVIAIGLLGVTAVLPVALNQMGHGNVADRAYRAGNDALSEIHVRQINNYNRLIWLNRNFGGLRYPNNEPRIEVFGQPPPVSWFPGNATFPAGERFPVDKYRGFAVDPMFLGVNGFLPQGGSAPHLFPYDTAPSGIRMERVSLIADTGVPVAPVPPPAYPNYTYPFFPPVMSRPAAELIFMHDDDLTFDFPQDKSLPPVQQYPSQARREFDGQFSWIATFAPTLDGSDAPRDTFTLSVVIFHRRDLTMAMNAVNERVLSVAAFNNGGFSGGEITLTGSTAEETDVKSGDWLMLMGAMPTATSGNSLQVFRWYRVVETEKESRDMLGNGTVWNRDVTLQGADWPTALANTAGSTQAVLVENVVGVYERTVEMSDTPLNY